MPAFPAPDSAPEAAAAASTGASGLISVDTARDVAPFDRMIFGGFLEHFHRQIYGGVFEPGSPLSDAQGFRTDVIAAIREMGITNVRWPGGLFVDDYHWEDGVGPDRPSVLSRRWGVEESNAFGTDEFVAWCRLAGVEPYLCTNASTGTLEEMANWVEYCNVRDTGRYARMRIANGHPEPHKVRYWSIGNEDIHLPWVPADEWGRKVVQACHLMLGVDSTLVIAAGTQPLRSTTMPILDTPGLRGRLHMLSIHGYYDTTHLQPNTSGFLQCMMRSVEPEREIAQIEHALAFKGLSDSVTIAFDEWNLRGWYHPMPWNDPENIRERDLNDDNVRYTMADALFSACFLNACLRRAKSVRIASISPLVNTTGPLYVHPEGIVKRTTFHVFALYTRMLERNVVDAHVAADALHHEEREVPALDAMVTCDDARRRFAIAIVNRHPEEHVACRLRVDGTPLTGPIDAQVLQGDSPDAYNDIEQPERVRPDRIVLHFENGTTKLPPHSLTVFRYERDR